MTQYLDDFKSVLEQEAAAVSRVRGLVKEDDVERLCEIYQKLLTTGGSLVFCGVGKSGLVGLKLAATFNSLGLVSFNLHPTDALHGDLGRIRDQDAIVLISKSGTTEEILKLMPYLSIPKERRIGLLGNVNSPMGDECAVVFDCSVEREACINNLAPTTSTTVTLALGDAMAVLFEKVTGLSKDGFATHHPAGLLGKSLRLNVEHLMLSADESAVLKSDATLKEAIIAMTDKPTGICCVVDNDSKLAGILVDGDIRRCLAKDDGLDIPVQSFMNKSPISTSPNSKAFEALELMEKRKNPISVLPVVENGKYVGVLRLHDLLKEGFSLKKN